MDTPASFPQEAAYLHWVPFMPHIGYEDKNKFAYLP